MHRVDLAFFLVLPLSCVLTILATVFQNCTVPVSALLTVVYDWKGGGIDDGIGGMGRIYCWQYRSFNEIQPFISLSVVFLNNVTLSNLPFHS
jgi:hypothetical protein